MAAPVVAGVGHFFGPAELVEFFVVDLAVFGSEGFGDCEAGASAGGGESAIGGAEERRSPVQDDEVFGRVGIQDAFAGFSQGAGEVVLGRERAAEENDAVDHAAIGEGFGGEDGDAGATGLGDEVHGAAGVLVLVVHDFAGEVLGAAAVAVEAGEVGEVAAGEGESPVEDADGAAYAAVEEAVAHAVGEDGFGFDAGEDEGETFIEARGVEGARLDEAEAAANPERGEACAEDGVIVDLAGEAPEHWREFRFAKSTRGGVRCGENGHISLGLRIAGIMSGRLRKRQRVVKAAIYR